MRQVTIAGTWNGWNGNTQLKLTDGSSWKQAEYHYEYHYAYRPDAVLDGQRLYVEGMSKPVQASRVM